VPDDLFMQSFGHDIHQSRMTPGDDAGSVRGGRCPGQYRSSMRSRSFDPINATVSRQLRISGS
jgi:hypothetical protein